MDDKTEILITGGTGSLGKTLVKTLLKKYPAIRGIRVFSRDELKQWQMKTEIKRWWSENCKEFSFDVMIPVSYLIGDVRDGKRLRLAMDGATHVIHTAAMKQVPACEEHPLEAIKTNVGGSQNVLESALACKSVKKVIGISTDKAVYPVNLYGITKAAMEKLFIQGNVYSHGADRYPRFSCCRYGNVLGSRGSILPLFKKQYEENNKTLTITDIDMTRFWTTLPNVAAFVIQRLDTMQGGEIFIPKLPSCRVVDIAKMLFPESPLYFKNIGIRPGEKLHECLLGFEESKKTFASYSSYTVMNSVDELRQSFTYESISNDWRLTKEEFQKFLKDEV